ncbi:MAG: hypothetical protein K2K57_00775 [Oscillospiraceae bacterium]|nr:hypothetical protein [Oscillospiraceae bacterium]
MANIFFMPFTNNANAVSWRNNLETAFLNGEGKEVTEQINNVRSAKKTYASEEKYYNELHDFKLCRQIKWLNHLLGKTAEIFDKQLEKLTSSSADVIVAALPEFFWIDINDNHKHNEQGTNGGSIMNYHKPLYRPCLEVFLKGDNPLAELTSKYSNLIFFAGTAVWKEINYDDHTDELMYNSMVLYKEGRYVPSVTKHNVSTIDGFFHDHYTLSKDKAGKDTGTEAPVTDFMGLRFTYDICLDFKCVRDARGNTVPLSTQLCNDNGINNVDVNVLIAAGMPVSPAYLPTLKSNCLLRCDGLANPYGQIFKNNTNISLNSLSDLISVGSVNIS